MGIRIVGDDYLILIRRIAYSNWRELGGRGEGTRWKDPE